MPTTQHHCSLVVDEDVGALEVTVEEVLGVAVVKGLHKLPGQALHMLLRELHQARLQKTHQIMVTVLKHQVEGTCVCVRGKVGSVTSHMNHS